MNCSVCMTSANRDLLSWELHDYIGKAMATNTVLMCFPHFNVIPGMPEYVCRLDCISSA